MLTQRILLSAAIFTLGLVIPVLSEESKESQVRQAIQRSLPYLEKGGVAWIKERKCVSCHQIPFMVWSYEAAGQQGFPIDRTKLDVWMKWSLNKANRKNLDGINQLLLVRTVNPNEKLESSYAAIAKYVIDGQNEDGSYAPNGQLPGQRRSKPEGIEISTMWAAVALATIPELEGATASRDKALKWLEQAKPGKSTEWLAVRILIEQKIYQQKNVNKYIELLRNRQNEDGGFGWMEGDTSDALATGQALYAILITGIDDPLAESTRNFLLSTQSEDGSWTVPSTLGNKKRRADAISNYFGSAWATIGLLQTLFEP